MSGSAFRQLLNKAHRSNKETLHERFKQWVMPSKSKKKKVISAPLWSWIKEQKDRASIEKSIQNDLLQYSIEESVQNNLRQYSALEESYQMVLDNRMINLLKQKNNTRAMAIELDILLDYGANPNTYTKQLVSVLALAALNNNFQAIPMLINAGAEPINRSHVHENEQYELQKVKDGPLDQVLASGTPEQAKALLDNVKKIDVVQYGDLEKYARKHVDEKILSWRVKLLRKWIQSVKNLGSLEKALISKKKQDVQDTLDKIEMVSPKRYEYLQNIAQMWERNSIEQWRKQLLEDWKARWEESYTQSNNIAINYVQSSKKFKKKLKKMKTMSFRWYKKIKKAAQNYDKKLQQEPPANELYRNLNNQPLEYKESTTELGNVHNERENILKQWALSKKLITKDGEWIGPRKEKEEEED